MSARDDKRIAEMVNTTVGMMLGLGTPDPSPWLWTLVEASFMAGQVAGMQEARTAILAGINGDKETA